MCNISHGFVRDPELKKLQDQVDIKDHHVPLHIKKRIEKVKKHLK